MDMRFYWLQDRVEQGQFKIYWVPGKYNLADYSSKLDPPSHHRKMRQIYMYNEQSPTTLQGCVDKTDLKCIMKLRACDLMDASAATSGCHPIELKRYLLSAISFV